MKNSSRRFRVPKCGPLLVVAKFMDNPKLQLLFYTLFLICFQGVIFYVRQPEEYYLVVQVKNVFINNCFDSDHNAFMDIRRVSDVWEWIRNVVIPGLYSNSAEGENWPDGDGSFSLEDASPFNTRELRDQMNYIDFTGGIMLRQARAAPGDQCPGGSTCYHALGNLVGDDVEPGEDFPEKKVGDTAPFGTTRGDKKVPQFIWWSQQDLGSEQIYSPSLVSDKTYPASGYFAAFMPFFSDEYLPYEAGTFNQITDFRKFAANATNAKPARFYCIRSTINGHDLEQECDPIGDSSSSDHYGNSNVVKRHTQRFFDKLKAGHWIDVQTRFVLIQMQLTNPNGGLAMQTRLVLEFPAQGGVLPSSNMKLRITDPWITSFLRGALYYSVFMVFVLITQELLTMYKDGIYYFLDIWNWADWVNFAVFFQTWKYLEYAMDGWLTMENSCQDVRMCREAGFFDDWRLFWYYDQAKMYIGINGTLQLLKLVKFTNVLVPKMSLLARTLQAGAGDLIAFTAIFVLSCFAFANLFFVLLGSNIDDYYSLPVAFLSCWRALFGDFDIDVIDDNSRDSFNSYLFLFYVFWSVFILLSMFLAILGEAQSIAVDENNTPSKPYGFLEDLHSCLFADRLKRQARAEEARKAEARAEEARKAEAYLQEARKTPWVLEAKDTKFDELDQRMRALEFLCGNHEEQLQQVIKDTSQIIALVNEEVANDITT